MGDDIVIRARGLGKRYRIGHQTSSYGTLRESLTELAATPLRKLAALGRGEPLRQPPDTIWALEDVDLEVSRGEVLGIIGPNGAGKSTLLKILSRITEPTTGSVELVGRVGSLLEVGTGFHPELTGRENIYLNGAILGMRKAEIDRRFDEIVAFAEVERFLDTPVKRYSSGMYVRLAFAVAAHMEPEILLVDEVLAVGDAAFQKKCVGKMGEVASGGRTILLVSHNMAAITSLCERAILLEQGQLVQIGPSSNVVGSYLGRGGNGNGVCAEFVSEAAPGNESLVVESVRITGDKGPRRGVFDQDEVLSIELRFRVRKQMDNFHAFVNVFSRDGTLAFGTASWDALGLEKYNTYRVGRYCLQCEIPQNLLNSGEYFADINGQFPGRGFFFELHEVLRWSISEIGGAGGPKSSARPGVVRPLLRWTSSRCGSESR